MKRALGWVVALVGAAAWAQGTPPEVAAPPDAREVSRRVDGSDVKVTFKSEAELQGLFSHYDDALRAQGWAQKELEPESDEIEAKYERGDERLELEVERKGPGSFEAEFDVQD